MVSDMRTVLVEDGTAHDADRNRRRAAPGRTKLDERTYWDFFRQYGWILVGTAGSWFLLDIAFYSQGLYQNVIYQNIGWVPPSYTLTPADECLQLAKAQTYVNLASTVPGYWFTVFTVEHIGRWWIQMGGFIMMTLFNSILAGMYNDLYYNQAVFIGLYCMTFFFANWGPNATTFVIPAEVFPAKFRSFGHGFSAAWGKLGSIIGVFGFKYMTLYTGDQLPKRGDTPAGQSLGPALGLLGGILGMGILTTLLVPETMGRTLEEMGTDEAIDEEVSESQRSASSYGVAKELDYYATTADKDPHYANGVGQEHQQVGQAGKFI
jgi:PHS family inorganic phosphate transporter-like MFS transporter